MSQMPEDDFENDDGVVNCTTQKEFREAVEDSPDDYLIYLRGDGPFRVPDVAHLSHQIVATEEVSIRGGHPDLRLNLHGDAEAFLDRAKYVWASTRGLCDIHNADAVCVVDDTYLFARDCGVVHAGERSQIETFECDQVVALDRAHVTLHGKAYCMAFERADVVMSIDANCTIEAHDFSRIVANSEVRIAHQSPAAMIISPYGEGDTIPFIGKTTEEWARTYDVPISLGRNCLNVYKYVERNEENGSLETGRLRGYPTRWEVGKRTKCADWDPSHLSYHGLHFASHPVKAAMMVPRGGEGHMLRCAIPADETVIMDGGASVKAPWADVIEEIKFDWRQVP